MWLLQTKLWPSVVWQLGCQTFSCQRSLNETHCPQEICSTCLSKESIPAFPFWNSKHPLPTRSLRSLRAAARSPSSALWLHHAHPFVAAEEKNLSHAEKQRVRSRSCGLQEVCQWTDCAPMWLLQTKLLASVVWQRGCQTFSCQRSPNETHCPKEICSTCLSKESIPFPPILFGIPSIHSLPEAWGPWGRQHAPPALHHHAHSFVAAEEKNLSHAEKQRVWSSCGLEDLLEYTDCTPMWLLQAKLLASVVWQLGCQTFSCQRSLNETHCPQEICSTCLSKESIPAFPFWNSKHPLPSWEPQYVPPALHFGCIMPIPSLQLQKEDLSYAEKKRVWSRSCGLQELFEIHLLCSQLWHETAANQWTVVEIELLATVGWKCGCQPFSCPRSQNKTYCRKEICSTCLFKESIPAIRLWNSKHPLPARTTSSALWLHHAQPFVAAAEKNLSHDEKQRVWSRSSGLQDLLQYTDCSLSRDMRLLQVNEEF